MRHRLNNDSHAFVRAIHLRTPGVPIRDVRIGVARAAQPLAWDTPPCRLKVDGDSAGGQKSSVAPPPVTITGVPQAMASSTGMLKPSARYGDT